MRHFLIFLLVFTLLAAATMWFRYGGGEDYPDVSTEPLLSTADLEVFLTYPEPIGNVAVSPGGRVFFTVHPESRPQGNRLLEYVEGASVPFPSGAVQTRLFDTVLGLSVDRHNRLWTIDNGNHGFGDARLIAFDLDSGDIVHDHIFDAAIAPAGSFLQDLAVTADGRNVFVADASVWRKKPGIVVYDVETRTARRVLDAHPSVSAQNYLIRNHVRDMRFLGGIVNLKTGVDGIALDRNDEWLYFAAINHEALFRVPVRALLNPAMTDRDLDTVVERYSRKPLNDGLETDPFGNVYIADVEYGSVFVVDADRELRTLVRSAQIRWADSLALGPDGWLYLADSAISEQVLKSRDYIRSRGPFTIFRILPPAYRNAAEAAGL